MSTCTSATALRRDALALAAACTPEVLSGEQAAAAVRDLATAEKALSTARMFLAVRVARSDAWRGMGHASAADWLAAQLGISVRQAHAQLSTAKRAERLPKTRKAMEEGKLSPDQADAVSDAATADPEAEDTLLDSASRDTNSGLKEKAAAAKAAATDSATKERRARAGRTRQLRTHADGTFSLFVRGPAADGARLLAMLRPHDEQIFRTHRRSDQRDTYDNRCYDALFALFATCGHPTSTRPTAPAPHSGSGGTSGTGSSGGKGRPGRTSETGGMGQTSDNDSPSGRPDPPEPRAGGAPPVAGAAPATGPPDQAPDPPEADPRNRLPGGENTKVIVRIDHAALARGHTIAGETCDIAGLGPVPVSTVQALLGDAFIAAVVTKGQDVVNVAHLGRRLSAHQRTAIEWMGLRCTNIACNRTIAIQIDHRIPWASNPETSLDNQDPLCPDCHRRKTHHGWHLETGTGARRFLPPGAPPDQPGATPRQHAARTTSCSAAVLDEPSLGSVTQPSLC